MNDSTKLAYVGLGLLVVLSTVLFATNFGLQTGTGKFSYVVTGYDTGSVIVLTDTVGGDVYVDDTFAGKTGYSMSVKVSNLGRGYHKFTLWKGEDSVSNDFYVYAGENRGQRVYLELN